MRIGKTITSTRLAAALLLVTLLPGTASADDCPTSPLPLVTCAASAPAVTMAGIYRIAGHKVRTDLAFSYEDGRETSAFRFAGLGAFEEIVSANDLRDAEFSGDRLRAALDLTLPFYKGVTAKASYGGSYSKTSKIHGLLARLAYGF